MSFFIEQRQINSVAQRLEIKRTVRIVRELETLNRVTALAIRPDEIREGVLNVGHIAVIHGDRSPDRRGVDLDGAKTLEDAENACFFSSGRAFV
ncbi:hypothetical protein D3C71_928320 [compost metagenome]